MKSRIVMLLVVVQVAIRTMANTATVNGIEWNYTVSDGEAEICNYIPSSWTGGIIFSPAISTSTTGAITIPSRLGGYPVRHISRSAFEGCDKLTSVTIPNGVTSIGILAFSGCSGLTNVTIPDSVTSIEFSAFSGCSGLTSVTIPNGVRIIWDGTFSGCRALTSITIPNSVTRIGGSAFKNCRNLKNIRLPNGLSVVDSSVFEGCNAALFDTTTIPGCKLVDGWVIETTNIISGSLVLDGARGIGTKAFSGCSKLTSVTIPSSVTIIGGDAFADCGGLTSVAIGNGVKGIGGSAFSSCTNLTRVTIPDSVTSIGDGAFRYCSGLEEITLPFVGACRGNSGSIDSEFGYIFSCFEWLEGSATPTVSPGMGTTRYYHQNYSTNALGGRYISYYNVPLALKSVTITDETFLDNGAFFNCSTLTNVTIGNSVTRIGKGAFSYCYNLTNITMPNSVTSIGSDAFLSCGRLTSVTIPGSVKSIGEDAFSYCGGLKEVHITDLAKWCEISFDDNPLRYAGNLFLNGSLVSGDMMIPDGVKSIGNYAFFGCSGLTSVTIPDSVRSIGAEAFTGCSGIASVTVPQCVCSRKSSSVFPAAYQSITNVVISDSVTSIGSYAFRNCSGLTSVTIPDSVTSIGEDAFSGCSRLKEVHITDLAKWCEISFDDNPLRYAGSLFLNGLLVSRDMMIPGGVKSIGNYAFYSCGGLTSVTIPDSVTSIGASAFYNCTNLTSVTIPTSVTNIGNYAFSSCSGVTAFIVDAANVKYKSVDGLLLSKDGTTLIAGVNKREVVVPDGVTNICSNAFSGYSKLANVSIPDGVANIGDWAFSGCSGLTSVMVPSSVISIGTSAFSGCGGLEEITLPFVGARRGDTGSASLFGYIFGTLPYADGIETVQYYSSYSSTSPYPINPYYTSYYIPSKLKKVIISDETLLDYGVFYNCSGLTSVTIPDSVMSIGQRAFAGCSGLTSVTMAGNCPTIGSGAFSGVNSSCVAYLPRDNDTYSVVDGKWYGMMVVYCDPVPVGPYTITFDANGGVGGTSVTLDYGAALAAPTVTREGYTFAGWLPSVSTTVPAANVTYTAQWKANQYTVTFDANGGIGGNMVTLDCGAVLDAPTVAREGYSFMGWSPDVPETVPASNAIYTAQWKINQYTMTFDANGGAGGTSLTHDYGTALVAPTVTREGYTFMGWSPAVSETVPASNATYTAQWQINQYTVTFDANGGVGGMTASGTLTTNGWELLFSDSDCTEEYRSAPIGNNDSTSMSLTLTGPYELTFSWKVSSARYDYLCWYLDGREKARISGTDGTWQDVSVEVPSGKHTIRWTYSKDYYSAGSGSDCGWVRVPKIMPPVSLDYGQSVGDLFAPMRTGYTFDGWFTEAIGGMQISASTVVTGDMTCYAHWTANQYTVAFNANGGIVDESSRSVAFGNFVGELPTPTRTGYAFKGWREVTNGKQISASTVVTGNMSLYADWADMYTVTFDANGGSVDESNRSVASGDAVGTLPTPTRTGHSFAGWWTMADGGAPVSVSTIVTEAVTCYAHWTVNHHLIAFNANGGDVDEYYRSVAFGTAVGTLPTPFRRGYIFDGWFTSKSGGTQIFPSTVISCAMTCYAHWTWTAEPIWTIDSAGALTYVNLNGCTAIVIPDVVTSIGDYVFENCDELTSVTIPGSVTRIGNWTFGYCDWLANVTIGHGVTTIGPGAFQCCNRLATVTIPNSVTNIEYQAFKDCSGLTSVTIPDSVTSIRDSVFSGCSGLTCVTIPDSVTSIGNYVFYNCSGLMSVEIGNSVTSIGDGAFSDCSGLTSVTIPDSVASIGASAFYCCYGLTSVAIPNGVTNIGVHAFHKCTNLTSVNIPNSVTSIRSSAFADCSGLTSVTIPKGVTSIGYSAFYNCSGLASVTIPDSVTGIESYAFSGCTGLTSVYVSFGDTDRVKMLMKKSGFDVTKVLFVELGAAHVAFDANGGIVGEQSRRVAAGGLVGELPVPARNGYTFSGWFTEKDGGTKVYATTVVADDVTYYAHWVANQYTVTFDANGGEGGKSVTLDCGAALVAPTVTREGFAFVGWSPIVPATVPAGNVTYTAQWAEPRWTIDPDGVLMEVDMNGVVDVVIPSGVTSIGYDVFEDCSGMRSVKIPVGVTSIDDHAFRFCANLTSVTIPNGVTYIGEGAFEGCVGLASVTIPDSVTHIGAEAFQDCIGLTSVLIPDGVEEIGSCAFYGCSRLASITVPDTVTSIGSSAFGETPFFDNIPDGLVIFGKVVCEMKGPCPASVEIPAGIVSIGAYAFNGCGDLEEVIIPDSVTSIGVGAFQYCSGLTDVTIPHGVDNIGSRAFFRCIGLTSVMIPKSVAKIGSNAFSQCNGLTSVYVAIGDVARVRGLMWNAADVRNISFVESNGEPGGDSYMVTFNPNGGSVSTTMRRVSVGAAIGSLPTPLRSGYALTGWFTESEGGVRVTEQDIVQSNGTYYAHWAEAWSVSLDPNGGMVVGGTVDVEKGKAVGSLPVPEREGYAFAGWWTAKTKGTKISASTKVTKNVTYYARWTARKYKVTAAVSAKAAGKVSGAGTKTFNGKVTLKATPTKGYVFVKWENLNDPDTPWPSALTYRQPSVSFKMGAANLSVRAVFAKKTADSALSLMVDPSVMWYEEDDPDREIAVVADSLSYPTVTLSGASAGIGLVRVAGTDNAYVLKVTDSSKMNPGVYTAKVTAKNRAGKSVAKSVKIVTPNSSAAIDAGLIAGLETSTLSPYVASGGMKTKWTLADLGVDVFATNGWKLASVTGLPTGLSWNGLAIVGTATKTGIYAVTFTMKRTVGSGKNAKTYTSVATATFKVNSLLPADLAGTYNGYANTDFVDPDEGEAQEGDPDEEESVVYLPVLDRYASAVKVTVAKDGKVTLKVGGVSLSGTGFDAASNGVYAVKLKKTQKITSGALKGKSKVYEAYLEIDTNMPWTESQVSGWYQTWTTGMSGMAAPAWIDARKDVFGASEEAKSVSTAVAKWKKGVVKFTPKSVKGKGYAYELAVGGSALSVTVKSTGVATLAGKVAGTKVSGTATLEVSPEVLDESVEPPVARRVATARFFSGKFIVEVDYELEGGVVKSASGRVWKK